MINASEIANAISAMDIAISFIKDAHTLTASRRLVVNGLIASRCKLEWALQEIKIEVENDLKRKGDFQ